MSSKAVATLLPAIGRAETTNPQGSTDDPAPPRYRETIEVVGATPIHGFGIQHNEIPSNVQVATAADLARTPRIHVGEQVASSFGNVHVNEAQDNPFGLLGEADRCLEKFDDARFSSPAAPRVSWVGVEFLDSLNAVRRSASRDPEVSGRGA
jgi:hypothetical protein